MCFRIVFIVITMLCVGNVSWANRAPTIEDGVKTESVTAKLPFGLVYPSYITHVINRSVTGLAVPKHWRSEQWRRARSIVGLAGALYLADQAILNTLPQDRTLWPKATEFGHQVGSKEIVFSGLLGLYVTSYLTNNSKLQITAANIIESTVRSGLTTQVLKMAFQRMRPCSNQPNSTTWKGPTYDSKNYNYKSFPSGHATFAFSTATVFAQSYANKKWVPWLSYGIATWVAASRVTKKQHWASDILVGSAIGYYTAKSVTKKNTIAHSNWRVHPGIKGTQATVTLQTNF